LTTDEKQQKMAYKEHFVTDMGNGGAICSHCSFFLGSDPFTQPDVCPQCNYTLVQGGTYIATGGSDF
jgi:predicted Zn-ribbon and HTH transcriptional regulator